MASSTARIAKDKGNASFKSGNWADAVGHYSAAVIADRTEPTYPLNRAAAYLKLGKHHDAEQDCTTVLSLDSKNVKALFRRAQARVALECLAEAEKDLIAALKLEPANISVKKELEVIQTQKIEAVKKQQSRREPLTLRSSSTSQPSSTPKFENDSSSRRITRNIPIEIIESDESVPTTQLSTDFLKPIHSRTLHPSSTTETLPPPTKPQPRVGAAIFRADGNHTILRTPIPERTPSPPLRSAAHSPAASASIVKSPTLPLAVPNLSAPYPPPSLTHFAFSRAWNALPTPQERFSLLMTVPPGSLPTLFQNSLEPEFLVSILRTFESVASPATNVTIFTYMTAFPSVPRFNTVLLFLNPKEKGIVRSVWDVIGAGDREWLRAWGM